MALPWLKKYSVPRSLQSCKHPFGEAIHHVLDGIFHGVFHAAFTQSCQFRFILQNPGDSIRISVRTIPWCHHESVLLVAELLLLFCLAKDWSVSKGTFGDGMDFGRRLKMPRQQQL